ncbi:MAG: hypothetical protein ABIS06_00385 [Vicinamibacterales bacterium]
MKTVTVFMVLAASSITAAGPAKGKVPVVPLAVIVAPIGTSGIATRMTADTGGAYVDGVQGVIARRTEFGGLLLDFQVGGIARRVFFDYSEPVDRSNLYHPPTDPVVASNLRMSKTSDSVADAIDDKWKFAVYRTRAQPYRRPDSPFDVTARHTHW